MSLLSLAQFAVANNNSRSPSAIPTFDLAIEEARDAVQIKDGNKIPKEDGSQSLTLRLGGITLGLDAIKAGATRVNVVADAVEGTIEVLRAALTDGSFDDAIVAAQEKARTAAAKKAATKAANLEAGVSEEASEGVDLEALDEEVLG